MQRRLALKIDVASYRGTRSGVPRLLDILTHHGARATFLFSLGPDRSGRAPRQHPAPAGRPGISRFYGTLLPAPDIGRRCSEVLRTVRDAGHEVGIFGYDPVGWLRQAADADAAWTCEQMEKACERFYTIFGSGPKIHGAPAWQMNAHALRATQRLGFDYCSDTRGTHPFIPVQRAEIVACPQLPTTLPPLDELMALDSADAEDGVRRLLALSAPEARHGAFAGHVFTLRAEAEGMELAQALEALLEGWREQGYLLGTLRDIYDALDLEALPRHEVKRGEVPGRVGSLMLQAGEFLA